MGAFQIFISEATVATADVGEFFHALREELADSHAVGLVFVFAVGVFPKDFLVIITVIIGNYFFTHVYIISYYLIEGVLKRNLTDLAEGLL